MQVPPTSYQRRRRPLMSPMRFAADGAMQPSREEEEDASAQQHNADRTAGKFYHFTIPDSTGKETPTATALLVGRSGDTGRNRASESLRHTEEEEEERLETGTRARLSSFDSGVPPPPSLPIASQPRQGDDVHVMNGNSSSTTHPQQRTTPPVTATVVATVSKAKAVSSSVAINSASSPSSLSPPPPLSSSSLPPHAFSTSSSLAQEHLHIMQLEQQLQWWRQRAASAESHALRREEWLQAHWSRQLDVAREAALKTTQQLQERQRELEGKLRLLQVTGGTSSGGGGVCESQYVTYSQQQEQQQRQVETSMSAPSPDDMTPPRAQVNKVSETAAAATTVGDAKHMVFTPTPVRKDDGGTARDQDGDRQVRHTTTGNRISNDVTGPKENSWREWGEEVPSHYDGKSKSLAVDSTSDISRDTATRSFQQDTSGGDDGKDDSASNHYRIQEEAERQVRALEDIASAAQQRETQLRAENQELKARVRSMAEAAATQHAKLQQQQRQQEEEMNQERASAREARAHLEDAKQVLQRQLAEATSFSSSPRRDAHGGQYPDGQGDTIGEIEKESKADATQTERTKERQLASYLPPRKAGVDVSVSCGEGSVGLSTPRVDEEAAAVVSVPPPPSAQIVQAVDALSKATAGCLLSCCKLNNGGRNEVPASTMALVHPLQQPSIPPLFAGGSAKPRLPRLEEGQVVHRVELIKEALAQLPILFIVSQQQLGDEEMRVQEHNPSGMKGHKRESAAAMPLAIQLQEVKHPWHQTQTTPPPQCLSVATEFTLETGAAATQTEGTITVTHATQTAMGPSSSSPATPLVTTIDGIIETGRRISPIQSSAVAVSSCSSDDGTYIEAREHAVSLAEAQHRLLAVMEDKATLEAKNWQLQEDLRALHFQQRKFGSVTWPPAPSLLGGASTSEDGTGGRQVSMQELRRRLIAAEASTHEARSHCELAEEEKSTLVRRQSLLKEEVRKLRSQRDALHVECCVLRKMQESSSYMAAAAATVDGVDSRGCGRLYRNTLFSSSTSPFSRRFSAHTESDLEDGENARGYRDSMAMPAAATRSSGGHSRPGISSDYGERLLGHRWGSSPSLSISARNAANKEEAEEHAGVGVPPIIAALASMRGGGDYDDYGYNEDDDDRESENTGYGESSSNMAPLASPAAVQSYHNRNSQSVLSRMLEDYSQFSFSNGSYFYRSHYSDDPAAQRLFTSAASNAGNDGGGEYYPGQPGVGSSAIAR